MNHPGMVGAMTYQSLRHLEVATPISQIPTLLPTHLPLLPLQILRIPTYRILLPHPPNPTRDPRTVLYTSPSPNHRTPTPVIPLVVQAAQGRRFSPQPPARKRRTPESPTQVTELPTLQAEVAMVLPTAVVMGLAPGRILQGEGTLVLE